MANGGGGDVFLQSAWRQFLKSIFVFTECEIRNEMKFFVQIARVGDCFAFQTKKIIWKAQLLSTRKIKEEKREWRIILFNHLTQLQSNAFSEP